MLHLLHTASQRKSIVLRQHQKIKKPPQPWSGFFM